MRVLRLAFQRFHHRFRAKLGVCPQCMRASAAGSVLSWGLTAGIATRPNFSPLIVDLCLMVACAFTALIAAHLTVYMVRVARAVRRREREEPPGLPPDHRILTRREFAGVVLRAGAWAAVVAFLGPLGALAQANKCTGKHEPNPRRTESGSGNTKEEALQRFREKAEDYCALLCEDLPCGVDGGCVREGPVVVTITSLEEGAINPWFCQGEIKSCTCACKKCQGTHGPLVFSENAWGFGLSEAEARADLQTNARAMCDKICARHKDCVAPRTCKRLGSPSLAEIKAWKHASNIWEASAKLIHCACDCV